MASNNLSIIIRSEQPADIDPITAVVTAAFETQSHSDQTEHLLVQNLRSDHAMTVSLVAELDAKIVGHIAFSKVLIGGRDIAWQGLAPVSVDPIYQGQGIGGALVRTGLDMIKNQGAKGCVLLGEPDYYNRFGFVADPRLILEGVPPEYFLVQSFGGETPSGIVTYHPLPCSHVTCPFPRSKLCQTNGPVCPLYKTAWWSKR